MSPVAFIIGFGKGVGSAVAAKFKSQGFNVAVASRSLVPGEVKRNYDYLGINLDMAKPSDVHGAFELVEKTYGPASVVVYNVSAFAMAPGGKSDPLSLSFNDFDNCVAVGGTNAFEVAKRALVGFDKLRGSTTDTPPDSVFIATGNNMPWRPPAATVLGLSVAKKILANVVEACATAYGASGKRFYYAYQVSPSDGPVRAPDPDTHASIYWKLYTQAEQGSWDVKFVKDQV